MDAAVTLDYLVIGAGPAGLQLAWFLHRSGRDYLVLEAGDTPGTFFQRFPRHRQMISINKPHTGWDDSERSLRMDWNSLLSDDDRLLFTRYTGSYFPHADDYLQYLTDFGQLHELRIRCGARVVSVTRNNGFQVTDDQGRVYRAKRLIVATGLSKAYIPEIPGIELTEKYTEVSVDPDDFTNQWVLVIGKGNSGFETADALVERAAVIHVLGPSSIKFAWRTHFIGHLRAVNNNFLDTYQLKAQNMVLDATIVGIKKAADSYQVTLRYSRRDKTVTLEYDRVIACTGFGMDTTIFTEKCRPQLAINDRFPALTTEWESVNIPDLYFAGTLTQVRDFKKYTSAFIHGFRYGIRALHHMLEAKYEDVPWPHKTLTSDAAELMAAVLRRINSSSGLFQQFGFMCDYIALHGEDAHYYAEVPVDHVHNSDFAIPDQFFTVTLEYGPGHDEIDPFDVAAGREWEADPSHPDRYLHPVIRHYSAGVMVKLLRLPEDLYNDWTGEAEYRTPLREFFAKSLAPLAL